MKKAFCLNLCVLLLFGVCGIQAFAQGSDGVKTAYHIYVRVDGSDENGDGSAQKPFASIQKAKDYVRTLDKTKGDIVVEIGDGTYELEDTLTFDAADSGTDACTVRYIASDGATPIISGGKTVKGSWTDEGNGIYSIPYARDEKLRALYVNGNRCFMTSRVVKAKGSVGTYAIEAGQADWAWVSGEAYSGVRFSRKDLPYDTRNADDIELMTQTTWNTTIVCVDSLAKKGLYTVANLQMPYGAFAQTLGWGNAYQCKANNLISNVFEWLDEAGEFYFDKSTHKLYYYPRAGEDLEHAAVVVPELEKLVDIEGTDTAHRAEHIAFEGLTFAYSDWNLNEADGSHGRATNQGAATLWAYAEEDWHGNIYREYDVGPAAVYISSAKDISLKNNTICHTGNDGLSLVNDVRDVLVDGNILFDLAGTSMLIGHPQHMYIGDKDSDKGKHSDREKYAPQTEALCQNIRVTNNLFKNTSRLFWGDPGLMLFAVDGMLFQYNQVENTPYSGLSLGWGWWNFNGDPDSVIPNAPVIVTQNNKILNNRFLNCITTLGDGGAIYTLGKMPNTVISENYICSIGTKGVDASYHIRGIHVDEGTQNVYGEKNVIDIDPQFACIDCGDWGKKGNNTWLSTYSTSSLYTTTETYEAGTKITDSKTVSDGNWDTDAQSVIDRSGLGEAYRARMAKTDIQNAESIVSIPEAKPNIPLIIGLSVGGALLAAAVVVAVFVGVKKKKAR